MKLYTLEFEKPIVELEQALEALHKQATDQNIDLPAISSTTCTYVLLKLL